jgi:hypothetical protein
MTISDDVKRAYQALAAKQDPYTELWNYYEGNPPIRFVTERLREIFGKEVRFSENWSAVVVDAECDRIQLNGFALAGGAEGEDDPLETRLNELFEDTELKLDADDVVKAAKVCGESFVFVWKEDGGAVEAYYNDPRLCHLFYEADRPHVKRMAAKWWVGDDKRRYLNLYYPERIEYYASKGAAANVTTASAFQPLREPAANPFGIIPVFHFRNDRRRITSALQNVIEPADAINKLFQDMMVAAEFGSFKQRWIITQSEIGSLKNAPNEIWELPAGDGEGQPTSAGEFSATELKNYLEAMEKIANDIARITRTPKHYLMNQTGDPSGEALIAMEAPLNKKAQKSIDRLTPEWKAVAAFMLRLDSGADVPVGAITPEFDRPETVQPRTEAEIREINGRAGIPLVTSLRKEGWTEAEIAQLLADRDEANRAQQSALADSLIEAQRRFDQGGNPATEDDDAA